MHLRRHSFHSILPSTAASSPVSGDNINQAKSSDVNLEIVLDIAVRAAAQNTGATAVAIALMDKGMLVCRARFGDIAPDLGMVLNLDTGITGECVRAAQVLTCDDTEKDKRVNVDVCRGMGIRSILVMPILLEGTVVGLLEALSDRPAAFAAHNAQWLKRVAAFVCDLAFGDRSIARVHETKVYPVTVSPPKVDLSEKVSANLANPNPSGEPLEQATGIAAFQEVLDQAAQVSSWDEICDQLASRLEH